MGSRDGRISMLVFSTLFPNAETPHHGVFVENRLRHLLAEGSVAPRVVAPVPWFPFTDGRFGSYAAFARVPRREERHGLAIDHPRYPLLPKIGMTLAPTLLYRWTLPVLRRVIAEEGPFDLIDAHYFYPDGVAAVMLGRTLGLPVTVTARGTDINLIPRFALARRQILWASRHASHMIAVCQALKDEMTAIGIDGDRVTVLRNGVDLAQFHPVDREAARRRLGLTGPTLVSVGGLVTRKGNEITIGALPELPDMTLLLAGDGPEEDNLRALADRLGVDGRVRLLGRVGHDGLAELYGAADALVLASSREGWANVLLEAMACGTPVVASNVWGTPEAVAAPEAGVLMEERTSASLARAVRRLFAAPPDRAATRRYAEGFSWDETTRGQLALFRRILGEQTDVGRVPPRMATHAG
jgi:teichuronic acid biosynthesis glycosyltransferase TuaC